MRRIIFILLTLCCQMVWAQTCRTMAYEPARYGVTLYYGKITMDTLGQVVGMNFSVDDETLYSAEFNYAFSNDSAVRHYFGRMIHNAGLNLNFTIHDDPVMGTIYEVDPYFSAHWKLFTLSDFLTSTFGIGEGISYVSKVPLRETRNSDDPQRFLNYLMFEFTFSSPRYPELELIARVHHRSGVFGLYKANNSGSTAVGLAARYYF